MNKTKPNLHDKCDKTDQLALQAVITCTGHYGMLLIAVDTELFDMN